jgi:hypothetical protein
MSAGGGASVISIHRGHQGHESRSNWAAAAPFLIIIRTPVAEFTQFITTDLWLSKRPELEDGGGHWDCLNLRVCLLASCATPLSFVVQLLNTLPAISTHSPNRHMTPPAGNTL